MNFVDTHCHLNDPSFSDTLPGVIARARDAGVDMMIAPAYDMASLERTAQIAALYPDAVFPAFGLHPWFVHESVDWDILRSYLNRSDAVAVGEIGLDFSDPCPAADLQTPVFLRQLDIAADCGLPVLIHCRKAYDRLYDILKSYKGRLQGVLHSYSGGKDGMSRFIDLNFYISFSGSVTRHNARKYHLSAQAVDPGRMLLETDAPSIATETTVASEVEPCHIPDVARKIADLRGLPLSEVRRLTTENACRLFSRLPRR